MILVKNLKKIFGLGTFFLTRIAFSREEVLFRI